MMHGTTLRRDLLGAALVTAAFLAASGCGTAPTSDQRTDRSEGVENSVRLNESPKQRAGSEASRSTGSASSRTPLLINGEPIAWSVLRPRLAEAGGGIVVDELALEHALELELRSEGIAVTEQDVGAERSRWVALIGTETIAAQTETAIRARRGLGPVRFERLLWRNAALRKLIEQAEIEPSEAEVRLAREIRSGVRYAVSGVVAPDSATALRLADASSRDSRGATAGLWAACEESGLRPWHALVSPVDPAYPQSLRRVLPDTAPGTPSGVIALDEGFGLVVVHAKLDGNRDSQSESDIREELRVRKTRLAMERLAERLVSRTSVHAMDRSLTVSD